MTKYQKVFLIDDDEVHNFICESIIRNYKFSAAVSCFLRAEEALKNLLTLSTQDPANFPDVIFLDINIPGMDGWAFIEEFKKLPVALRQNCHLFVLSSAVNKNTVSPSHQLPVVTDYFSKPLSTDTLDLISDLYPIQLGNDSDQL